MFPFHSSSSVEQNDEIVLPVAHASDGPIPTEVTNTQLENHHLSPSRHAPPLESTSHDITLNHELNVPSPIPPRSERITQPSVKLREFHPYHLTKVAPNQSASSPGTHHPLSRYISYAQLSPTYRFLFTLLLLLWNL